MMLNTWWMMQDARPHCRSIYYIQPVAMYVHTSPTPRLTACCTILHMYVYMIRDQHHPLTQLATTARHNINHNTLHVSSTCSRPTLSQKPIFLSFINPHGKENAVQNKIQINYVFKWMFYFQGTARAEVNKTIRWHQEAMNCSNR